MRALYLKGMNDNLQKDIGISFSNPNFLDLALTHSSFNKENNNERLCFLGDAVLNMIAAEYLFKKFPEYSEGVLTKMRAGLVSRKALSLWAKNINLGNFILLSQGEEKTGGRKKVSILAEAMEGLIGAIFIDSGISNAKAFAMEHLSSCKEEEILDFKSALQELAQKKKGIIPVYKLIEKSGKEHKPLFKISVSVDEIIEIGNGKSKKEAEQEASKKALEKLQKVYTEDFEEVEPFSIKLGETYAKTEIT